uniref:Zinc finger protein 687 n=1 Tax=Laticauda laticaudata TaxID=8630 RepID=A0A8C5WNF9_LATLA
MGDMKTPDFDDLLAAFDIPDIDTSEAIHSGHEEAEPPVRPVPVEVPPPEHALPHADITTVSVIVKNTVCPEQLEPADGRLKDGSRLLQNGFAATEVPRSSPASSAEAVAPANGECWALKEKAPKSPDLFSPFSPEPPKDGETDLIDQPRGCQAREPGLAGPAIPPVPLLSAAPSLDGPGPLEESLGPSPPLPFPPAFEPCPPGGMGLLLTPPPLPPPRPAAPPMIKQEVDCEVPCQGSSPLGQPKSAASCYSAETSPCVPWPDSEADLQGELSGLPDIKHRLTSPREQLFQGSPPKGASPAPRASPRPPGGNGSLKEEPVEKPLQCLPGPPSGEEEEEEEEEEEQSPGSPSSGSSRPLKVRIKTIKTSSGSITRTVTRVSSDADPAAAKLSCSQAPPESLVAVATQKEEAAPENPGPKALAKAAEAPQVVSVQLGDGTKLKGTVLPVSPIQSASSAMLMAASVAQQKAVVLPSKALAKSILSLVPQALPKAPPEARGPTLPAPASQKLNGTTVVVMQPQKAPPPVAGTVISRSQSSLVEAFNRILNSKNLLPPYKPNLLPPAESSLALPPLGYRCLECGDAFALERSLARHYDRRSLRVEVTCNHCARRLVFFNKCSLLLHAREHKDKGLVMQCSHLVMRPIALDQMVGQPDVAPLLPLAALSQAGKAHTATPAGLALDVGVANGGAGQDLPVLPLGSGSSSNSGGSSGTEQPAAPNSCQCLECKEQCKDKAGLAAHFQQAGSTTSTVCPSCPMIMANRCSFSAHQRMHKSRPPHICPECGGNFLLANFDAHLKDACLHFSRRIGYRCPSCSVVFGGVNSIKSHIQASHCEVFHKCPVCPMAFKSAPSAHGHIYTQHPGFSNQQSKMIYKCAMCDTVFTHKPLLSSHFDQHLVNQRVSVFKCPDCPLPAPGQPEGERLQVPRLPSALRPEEDHAGAPQEQPPAAAAEAQGGSGQEAAPLCPPQAGPSRGGAPATRPQGSHLLLFLLLLLLLLGRPPQLPRAAQEQTGPVPAQGGDGPAVAEQRVDLRHLPLLVPREGRVRGAHEEGPREVCEEVPLPPV